MGMTIVLPWPPKELNPNARIHWAPKAKAVASYRSECGWRARAQGVYPVEADRVHMTIRFCPPDARRRDMDNLIGATKSARDALMDALMVDDSRFVVTYEMGDIVKGGAVEVDL
jgi:crossover junction endodeoxyribonuclease RusA